MTKVNKQSKTLIFGAIVIIAAAIFVWKFADNNSNQNNSADQAVVQTPQQNEVNYYGVAGENALVLLKQQHRVQTKSYKGLGEQVISIDGVSADGKHFWSFNVNGKLAPVGAGSYTTKNGDKITWKLEEIK